MKILLRMQGERYHCKYVLIRIKLKSNTVFIFMAKLPNNFRLLQPKFTHWCCYCWILLSFFYPLLSIMWNRLFFHNLQTYNFYLSLFQCKWQDSLSLGTLWAYIATVKASILVLVISIIEKNPLNKKFFDPFLFLFPFY